MLAWSVCHEHQRNVYIMVQMSCPKTVQGISIPVVTLWLLPTVGITTLYLLRGIHVHNSSSSFLTQLFRHSFSQHQTSLSICFFLRTGLRPIPSPSTPAPAAARAVLPWWVMLLVTSPSAQAKASTLQPSLAACVLRPLWRPARTARRCAGSQPSASTWTSTCVE